MSRIRIAFIKYAGLSAGGTEKFLQTIAANLDKNKYDVTYFYCDATPYIGSDFSHPGTDVSREQYLLNSDVKLVKFSVIAKNVSDPYHPWVGTDFWDVFDETKFDLIQTGRAGHPEFPFNHIRKTPIIDSIHLNAGVDNQQNIAKVLLLGKWSLDQWVRNGGDRRRAAIVSHPTEPLRFDQKIIPFDNERPIVFGFHQRVSNEIYSEIPILAFSKISQKNVKFKIMGGGSNYQKQAKELGLSNIEFVSFSSESADIEKFIASLDVYAHGRKDGEINSTAIAEALRHGKPVLSHVSRINNGHIESIGDAGYVAPSAVEYARAMEKFIENRLLIKEIGQKALTRFQENYELFSQMNKITNIYDEVFYNGYVKTSRLRAFLLKLRAKIRRLAKDYLTFTNFNPKYSPLNPDLSGP